MHWEFDAVVVFWQFFGLWVVRNFGGVLVWVVCKSVYELVLRLAAGMLDIYELFFAAAMGISLLVSQYLFSFFIIIPFSLRCRLRSLFVTRKIFWICSLHYAVLFFFFTRKSRRGRDGMRISTSDLLLFRRSRYKRSPCQQQAYLFITFSQ